MNVIELHLMNGGLIVTDADSYDVDMTLKKVECVDKYGYECIIPLGNICYYKTKKVR